MGDFADLRTGAIYAARRSTARQFDIDRAGEAVNDGAIYVCDTGDEWDFLIREGQLTLTAGEDLYSLDDVATALALSPNTVEKILSITDDVNGGQPLMGGGWEQLEASAYDTQDGDPTGAPIRWTPAPDRRFRVWPAPDSDLVVGLRYRLRQGQMTLPSDTPLIPLTFRRPLLIPYAAARLLEQSGGTEALSQARIYDDRFNQQLAVMRMSRASAAAEEIQFRDETMDDDLPGSWFEVGIPGPWPT